MNFYFLANNNLLEQLHDIEGIDAISVWPLAIGWWVAGAVGVAALSIIIYFGHYWLRYMRSWRSDTFQKLALLEKNLSEATARETVIALSEYIRRIVLRRFPRKECAGLVGKSWLKWLTKNDPKKFDWEKKGILLIDIPYAPVNDDRMTADSSDCLRTIKELIQAVREWVC